VTQRSWSEPARLIIGTGAGHGFASNAFVLLAGRELLGARGDEVSHRAADVIGELALEEDGLVQWLPMVDTEVGRRR
jgi:hypothetical protein